MVSVRQIQLGKQGITDNFIESLKNHFKNCKNVKISVLRSAREDKSSVKKYAQEITKRLGDNYKARVIGFVIAVRKMRKSNNSE